MQIVSRETFLWQPFPADSFAGGDSDALDFTALQRIFSASDPESFWRQAIGVIGLVHSGAPLVRQAEDGSIEFNMAGLAYVVSGGTVRADATGKLMPPLGLWAHIKFLMAQWRVARFIAAQRRDLHPLTESIALGICLQSLMLRLGQDNVKIAQWLSGAQTPPPAMRQTLRDIQQVQMRRTQLSPAWEGVYIKIKAVPDGQPFTNATETRDQWQGLPVCLGEVRGRAIIADKKTAEELFASKAAIFIFRHARPHTTDFFLYCRGIIFANGGVTSHACTVARDMNIPAVTGIGDDFYAQAAAAEDLWITLDGAKGTIALMPAPVA